MKYQNLKLSIFCLFVYKFVFLRQNDIGENVLFVWIHHYQLLGSQQAFSQI